MYPMTGNFFTENMQKILTRTIVRDRLYLRSLKRNRRNCRQSGHGTAFVSLCKIAEIAPFAVHSVKDENKNEGEHDSQDHGEENTDIELLRGYDVSVARRGTESSFQQE